jgi:hypothetical protein
VRRVDVCPNKSYINVVTGRRMNRPESKPFAALATVTVHVDTSRYYSDGFTRPPTQFQLGRKRTNVTSVLRGHFYCVGIIENECTGNGLVVPSSSHKREVAGWIPSGCTKTFIFPLPLLPLTDVTL